jgi:hypothetical protein
MRSVQSCGFELVDFSIAPESLISKESRRVDPHAWIAVLITTRGIAHAHDRSTFPNARDYIGGSSGSESSERHR